MVEEINILFSAAGRRVSLIRHFKKVLNDLGLRGRVISADINLLAPASYITDEKVLIPKCTNENYIETLIDICKTQRVSLLTSLIDTDLILLSENRDKFERVGTKLLISSVETNEICFNKINTAKFFKTHNVSSPCTYSLDEALNFDQEKYPVLLKPFDGSSGVGVTKINNKEELIFFAKYIKNAMIQEYLEGEEYTVDVYVDFKGKIRCAVPRKRLEIRGGEVSKGVTVKDKLIMKAACDAVSKLPGTIGCITIQCFKTKDNQIKFIEINPRFGGGFPLSLHAKADFPKWILQELVFGECNATMDDWLDDLAMLRYDEEIIVNGDQIK